MPLFFIAIDYCLHCSLYCSFEKFRQATTFICEGAFLLPLVESQLSENIYLLQPTSLKEIE